MTSTYSKEDFKTDIQRYADLDEEIKKGSKALSALRKEKKALEPSILDFMKKHEYTEINLGNEHQILRVTSTSTESLKPDALLEDLTTILGSAEYAERVADAVLANRAVIEKESLKKIKQRAKKTT
jgi:hypothetical protein